MWKGGHKVHVLLFTDQENVSQRSDLLSVTQMVSGRARITA